MREFSRTWIEESSGRVRAALHRLSDKHKSPEHFDASSVHHEMEPGSSSLSSVRRHLKRIAGESGYSKTDTGAGRGRFVGYRRK